MKNLLSLPAVGLTAGLLLALTAGSTLVGCASEEAVNSAECRVVEVGDARYCIVRRDAITETGYDCPPEFAFRHQTEHLVVCGEVEGLPSETARWLEERHGGWDIGEGNAGQDAGEGNAGQDAADGDASRTAVLAADFGRSCVYDDDCVTVEIDACDPGCTCSGPAAISRSEYDAYLAQSAQVCGRIDHACNNCHGPVYYAICDDGLCRSIHQELDSAPDLSTCSTDDDCTLGFAGSPKSLCEPCPCAPQAFNRAALSEAVAAANGLDDISCNPLPQTCAACEWGPVCDDGVCVAMDEVALAAHCPPLGAEACEASDACSVAVGYRFDPARQCFGPATTPYGCAPAGTTGGVADRHVRDESGECWMIAGELPEGWTDLSTSSAPCTTTTTRCAN